MRSSGGSKRRDRRSQQKPETEPFASRAHCSRRCHAHYVKCRERAVPALGARVSRGAGRAVLALACVALVGTACSQSRSASPSGTPAHSVATGSTQVRALPPTTTSPTSTTTTTMSTAPSSAESAALNAGGFSVQPCAVQVTSPAPTSNVDLRPFLLGAKQLPAKAVIDGPHQTAVTPPVYASVPTTSPAAFENITLYSATTNTGSGTASAFMALKEVIGDVGSTNFASQLLPALDADLNGPGCYTQHDIVPLPGASPPVSAIRFSGAQRGRVELGETLFAAKGSRLVCLSWSGQVYGTPGWGSLLAHFPPLPDAAAMARDLKTALALIPD